MKFYLFFSDLTYRSTHLSSLSSSSLPLLTYKLRAYTHHLNRKNYEVRENFANSPNIRKSLPEKTHNRWEVGLAGEASLVLFDFQMTGCIKQDQSWSRISTMLIKWEQLIEKVNPGWCNPIYEYKINFSWFQITQEFIFIFLSLEKSLLNFNNHHF